MEEDGEDEEEEDDDEGEGEEEDDDEGDEDDDGKLFLTINLKVKRMTQNWLVDKQVVIRLSSIRNTNGSLFLCLCLSFECINSIEIIACT